MIFGTHQKAERLKMNKAYVVALKSGCCDLDMGNPMESKKALEELRESWSWASLKDAQNHLKSH